MCLIVKLSHWFASCCLALVCLRTLSAWLSAVALRIVTHRKFFSECLCLCVDMIVSSQVSWLSIQFNGITAVVGPHTILTVLHTHIHSLALSVWSLCVCRRAAVIQAGLKIRMEKEDLKIVNKDLEDEMVSFSFRFFALFFSYKAHELIFFLSRS